MDRPISLEARSVVLAIEPAFRLGRARVDPEAHEYTIAGKATRMQPQALKVLIALHDKSGRVVSRDELIDRCWSGRIVGDDVINRCISVLRPFAAQSGGFRIETISGAGYRLTEHAAATAKRKHDETLPPLQAYPLATRRLVLAGGGAAIAAAAVGGWIIFRPESNPQSNRIAVLPFANLTGDPAQAYFSDGTAEEVRQALSRVGMQVIGRTSCEAVRNMDAKAAASKLGVPNILIGSVRRSSGTIRIDAQLVSGKDGVERWSQSYDRAPGDVIKIQTDIAENVARALSIALGQGARTALTLGGTADAVAQDLVLQAYQIMNRATAFEDYRRSLALVDAAIARDPRYAGAYVAKAIVHREWANSALTSDEVTEHSGQAYSAAQKAIELAPTWGRAYTTLSTIEQNRLDFAGALRMAKRALSLSPHDSVVVGVAAATVGFLQNVEAGLRLAERAIALDPLRAATYQNKAFLLVFARQYREAIGPGRKALSLRPEEISSHLQIGDALLLLGRPAQAKAEYESANEGGLRTSRLAILAARTGDRAQALELLEEMKRAYGAATSYQHAEIYAQLNERDKAFEELDAAVRWGDGGLAYVKFDPFLDPIRTDPRYATLLGTLNFP